MEVTPRSQTHATSTSSPGGELRPVADRPAPGKTHLCFNAEGEELRVRVLGHKANGARDVTYGEFLQPASIEDQGASAGSSRPRSCAPGWFCRAILPNDGDVLTSADVERYPSERSGPIGISVHKILGSEAHGPL